MVQFARFIRPGYYRVECNVYPPSFGGVSVTAYKDPASSKVVIVAVNTSSSQAEQTVRLQNGALNATFTPYTTSETLNCEKSNDLSATNGNFTFTMEPLSITTFISN